MVISKYCHIDSLKVILICFGTIQIFIFSYILKGKFEEQHKKIAEDLSKAKIKFEEEKKDSILLLEKEKKNLYNECFYKNSKLDEREKQIRSLLKSKSPFKDCSIIATNMELLIFNETIRYLKYKTRPAIKTEQIVRDLKKEYKTLCLKYKELEYKVDYIINAFPEISEYLDSDEDLISIGESFSYEELENNKDRRKDYLSEEEYRCLNDSEKSQLALDRYINGRSKTKWQIGRDYEMCCAFQLQKNGYKVELHGIKYQKNDLGRDLIASMDVGGLFGFQVYIIQCKYWSKDRVIHENVIMQLFGSAYEYQLGEGSTWNREVIPVLMIPPHSIVSDKAKLFATKLNVKIWILPYDDFPRIKCNINNGNKIYHLPFDQMYDRTEIKKEGELYAYTVKEAESKGFRRAHKHIFNS